jgi:adenine-specific DNA-methyltransferase
VTTDALGRLQALLRELFQFESKELDFGIYRIMNHKRTEIRRFIGEGLPRAVDEALKGGVVARQAAQTDELRQKTDRVKETFGEYAINTKGELNESFNETRSGAQSGGRGRRRSNSTATSTCSATCWTSRRAAAPHS